MALILTEGRPVGALAGGDFDTQTFGDFAADMESARTHLKKAIAATGRVEMAGSPAPFVATAFAVAPHLFVTAGYVGDILAPTMGKRKNSKLVAWLDMSEAPAADKPKLGIRAVHRVHPHWDLAFLEVEGEVEPLALAAPDMRGQIGDRAICLVGYPAMDVRNDAEHLRRIFSGESWGNKHLMPGRIRGTTVQGTEQTLMIEHDASTSGGTAGAPLVDLQTGLVVGFQHSGNFRQSNWAVPGWEINRDPQWLRLWQKGPVTGQLARPSWANGQSDILRIDDMNTLTALLVNGGLSTQGDLDVLFAGLPPGFLAQLPTAERVGDRLRRALVEMNRVRIGFGGRLPLYYVIENAKLRRNWDPQYCAAFEPFLATIRQVQETLPKEDT